MKKRIVSIIVVMAVLATLLAGCNLITLNAERDGSQVVSTVDVDGLTGIVTKSDLIGFFNQLGYMYIQYGMSPEKIITEFTEQLSNKEILVLYATKTIAADPKYNISFDEIKTANDAYIANERLRGSEKRFDKTIRPFDLFKLMDADEKMYVINQTNKTLEDNYKAILEDVKNEHAANAPEKDDEENKEEDKKDEEETLEPRKQRTYTPVTEFEKDPSITDEMVKDDYALSFFTKMDAKITAKELSEVEKEAYNKLQKNLNKAYKDSKTAWNVLLDGQKEYRLMNKYKDEYVNNEEKDATLVPTEAEILSRYQFTVNADLARIKDDASYKTAFEADQNNDLIVHNNKTGYFMVKSILLKFNKDQEKALDAIKKGALSDSDNKVAISAAREQLAINPEFDVVGIGENVGGIKVNVSNPNYDPKAVCEDKNCKCINCVNNPDRTTSKDCKDKNCTCVKCPNSAYDRYDVPFLTILDEMSTALADSSNIIMPEEIAADPAKAAAAKLNAKMDTFTDWLYLVNDDPGMFEKNGYAVSAQGESSYVAEYVALARELEKKAIADKTIGVVGGLGDVVVANPIDEKNPDITIHAYKAENGEEINYIVNDFGIHIVMVTYVPTESETLTTKVAGKDDLYLLNKEYVVSYANKYVVDEDGKPVLVEKNGKMVKQLKSLENKTIAEKISDKIMDEKKSEKYSKHEKEIAETEKYVNATVKNDKLINSIIKDIEDSLRAQGYDPEHGHNHTH